MTALTSRSAAAAAIARAPGPTRRSQLESKPGRQRATMVRRLSIAIAPQVRGSRLCGEGGGRSSWCACFEGESGPAACEGDFGGG